MGSSPSSTRVRGRDDLQKESGYEELMNWDEAMHKRICLNNAAGLGLERRTLEEMLQMRAANAPVDFCKERTYSFPTGQTVTSQCLALYGLYSGFKFQSRKACQDRVLMKEIHLKNKTSYLMLGIFDGHGHTGEHCSGFVVNNIYKYAEHYLNKFPEDMHKALVKTFNRTNKNLHKFSKSNSACDVNLSGTTATCVLVPTHAAGPVKIHVAHVGDSKAALSSSDAARRKEMGVLDLTIDHNFDDPFESDRARKTGGVVDRIVINGQPQGPLRVFSTTDRIKPGLAVSRSLGDGEAHKLGVSADPDILHLELKDGEDVLILASDGIWDMLSAEMILERLDKNGWNAANFEKIILECARRWIFSRTGVCDDLSIIIFKFDHKASPSGDARLPELNTEAEVKESPPLKTGMSDIPKPSLDIKHEFDVADPEDDLGSPTMTLTDEQKIRKSMRRGTLTMSADLLDGLEEQKTDQEVLDLNGPSQELEDIPEAFRKSGAADAFYKVDYDADASVGTDASVTDGDVGDLAAPTKTPRVSVDADCVRQERERVVAAEKSDML